MNSSLFLELEEAVNAVEPRVWEDYNPGLSDAQIDAIMKNVSFDLPDDLRALYRWKNGSDQGASFLGPVIQMLPLAEEQALTAESKTPFVAEDWSHYIREEIREFYDIPDEPLPFDIDTKELVCLFDDGGDGTYIIGVFAPQGSTCCEIWQFYPADAPSLSCMFRGVEAMINTALEWWRLGLFASRPHNYEPGWCLDQNFPKALEIGKRLNPDCNYWLDGATQ